MFNISTIHDKNILDKENEKEYNINNNFFNCHSSIFKVKDTSFPFKKFDHQMPVSLRNKNDNIENMEIINLIKIDDINYDNSNKTVIIRDNFPLIDKEKFSNYIDKNIKENNIINEKSGFYYLSNNEKETNNNLISLKNDHIIYKRKKSEIIKLDNLKNNDIPNIKEIEKDNVNSNKLSYLMQNVKNEQNKFYFFKIINNYSNDKERNTDNFRLILEVKKSEKLYKIKTIKDYEILNPY